MPNAHSLHEQRWKQWLKTAISFVNMFFGKGHIIFGLIEDNPLYQEKPMQRKTTPPLVCPLATFPTARNELFASIKPCAIKQSPISQACMYVFYKKCLYCYTEAGMWEG